MKIGAVSLLALVVAFIGYNSIRKMLYKQYAAEMKETAFYDYEAAYYAADYIMQSWKNRNAQNAQSAIDNATKQLSEQGIYELIDSLSSELTAQMADVKDAPFQYKEAGDSLIALYRDVCALNQLVSRWRLTYDQYASKANNLQSSINTNMKFTDIYFPIPTDSIKKQATSLVNVRKRKYFKNQTDYIENFARQTGVQKIECNEGCIYYKVLKEGDGRTPDKGDMVKCEYEGKTADGKMFDSTINRGAVTLPLSGVIPGFAEAVSRMPVGSVWEIVIPQELAYGSRGSGGVEPYSTLIFTISLLSIE